MVLLLFLSADWYHPLLDKKKTFQTLCSQEILVQKQAAIAALRRDVARECKVGGLNVSKVKLRVSEMIGPVSE